tara:strand:+ start:2669 stop:3934 length:1266 start_codon:yes stop_codon:yes gene_type:complete
MPKTQRKNKRKTQRKKRSIRNRREAKKYIELLNHAYKCISSSFHDLLDKEDYLLLPYLKTGFNRGWRVLNDKNIVKEIKCNSLCMTVSILNSTLGNRKKLDDLNPLQKLYLFFISYLVQDSKLSKKEVDLKHALRKLDLEIQYQINRKNDYIKKGDNRNIKKCDKVIIRRKEAKEQLIESIGKNRSGLDRLFKLDVCREIDCEYLHEYQMEKGQKYSESYSKFCLNITELFKGVVWLNMNLIFNRSIKNPFHIDFSQDTLDLNISVRDTMNKVDIILIPSMEMYNNDIFYSDKIYEKALKGKVKNDNYWVYTKLNKNDKTIRKISIKSLENKHYVTAQLCFDDVDGRLSELQQANETYKLFNDFVKGEGKLPVLNRIQKSIRNIGGNDKYDLNEIIYNSITVHWLYIHRDVLNEYISTSVI